MAREFAKKFYNSKRWRDVAELYRIKRFGICERCGVYNARQVHHKIELSPKNIDDADITLDEQNLELLCSICHQQEHNLKYSATIEGLSFDKNGNLIKHTPHL